MSSSVDTLHRLSSDMSNTPSMPLYPIPALRRYLLSSDHIGVVRVQLLIFELPREA
jgi:hypothetical protein